MHKYRLVAKKGEGTFSEVLKAQSIKNGKYVAIKCMKNHFDSLDQVNNLREIQALRRLSPHANIIKLLEVLYDQPTGRLALVFELMDMNIYELIRGRRHYVAEDRVKNYMYQLMKSMDHMHRNGIFHRDIKPENILIMDDCLKLADFGSCRGIYSKQPYTEYISTRWYRAPECLLTDGYYNYKMDMWGVGCVFFEIVSLFPLFPGTNELDQIQKIHNILGTPPADLLAKMKKRSQHMDFNFPAKEGTGIAKLIPHVAPDCVDLIIKLLAYNPDERLSARQSLRHPYFKELREAEKRQKALMTPDANPTGGIGSTMPGIVASGSLHQELDSKLIRHQSPAGSNAETTTTGAAVSSPPDTSRAADAGLPAISKPAQLHPPPAQPIQQQHSNSSHILQPLQPQQPAQQHALPYPGPHMQHPHLGTSLGGAGGAGDSGNQRGIMAGTTSDPADDSGTEGPQGGRLIGLQAENSMDTMSMGNESGALPPIGNASLGKANVGGSQTQRRAVAGYSYENSPGSYGKNKTSGVAAAAKRQGMAPQPKYSVNKAVAAPPSVSQVAVAGHKVAAALPQPGDMSASGQAGYKFKANAAKAGNTKYISPYSLRQLAAVGSGKDNA